MRRSPTTESFELAASVRILISFESPSASTFTDDRESSSAIRTRTDGNGVPTKPLKIVAFILLPLFVV